MDLSPLCCAFFHLFSDKLDLPERFLSAFLGKIRLSGQIIPFLTHPDWRFRGSRPLQRMPGLQPETKQELFESWPAFHRSVERGW